MIIILSFRFGTSKTKNIDHWVKVKKGAIMSTQVGYETDHIFTGDSTMSSALKSHTKLIKC